MPVHRIGHNYFKYLWIQVCVGVIAAHMCLFFVSLKCINIAMLTVFFFFSSPVFVWVWSQEEAWYLTEANYWLRRFLNFVRILQLAARVTERRLTSRKRRRFAPEKALLCQSEDSWSTGSCKLMLHAFIHVHPHKYVFFLLCSFIRIRQFANFAKLGVHEQRDK